MNFLSRRAVLKSGGALVVAFQLGGAFSGVAQEAKKLPGSLKKSPFLDSWIRIGANGRITVFTGKSEIGQGIKTALMQVAAEELCVETGDVDLITSDTALTPNEGFTSGSLSMADGGTAILNAAAQTRAILIGLAATRLQIPVDGLRAENGAVVSEDGRRLRYAELVQDLNLHVEAGPVSQKKNPASYAIVGQPMQRVDIPAKVSGGLAYVQDMRLPNMLHARVVRPPNVGAKLLTADFSAVEKMPGVRKMYRDGNYLAVVTEGEYQAVAAQDALRNLCEWDVKNAFPREAEIFHHLLSLHAEDDQILNRGAPSPAGKKIFAEYRRPYQMHASVGPSCAIGLFENGELRIWSHAQGMFPLRKSLSELLKLPSEKIRCTHVEGSGCYGHNGADDAAADAAILAIALPGRPVRVQFMRDDEHGYEPFGSVMLSRAQAVLGSDGSVMDWQYEVWSNPHSTRPGGAGNFIAGWLVENPFEQPPPRKIPQPSGGGDRNAIPLYNFPNARVTHHFIPEMPLRVSALRSLGAYANVFALESFMDELASEAGADPVAFRLKHLDDPRARDVVEKAAENFGWPGWKRARPGHGRGFAFAKYKNIAAYCAIALDLEADRETGMIRLGRAVAVDDSGQAVNPDGIRNQIEGAIVQSASWTLFEEVHFDEQTVTSRDWATYPILRFKDLFQSVAVGVIDRPGAPYLGTGEAGQGPTAAAIANALADAIGVRVRQLPLTPARIRAAANA